MGTALRVLSAEERFAEAQRRAAVPGSQVLARFNAQRAAERARARLPEQAALRAARARRGFDAGALNRLNADWFGDYRAINSAIEAALPRLRARSRDFCNNTGLGRRFLTLCANNIVGPAGFQFQSVVTNGSGALDTRTNDAVEAAFRRWAAGPEKFCDIARRRTLRQLTRSAVKAAARDGEALIRRVRGRDAGPFGYALQLNDADRVDHTYNDFLANGHAVRMGVQFTAAGRIVGYHLLTYHPGDTYQTAIGRGREFVSADDALLLFVPERAEQVRGYPWLHAVLLDAQMAAGFQESAVVAARAGASKMGWFTRSIDAVGPGSATSAVADETDDAGIDYQVFEPGTFGELPPGYEFNAFNPDYPHQAYAPFMTHIMHALAAGADVAHHNLSGDMSGVNYSSARIAEMSERDGWEDLQAWVIEDFLNVIGPEWADMALLSGQIKSATGLPISPEKREAIRTSMQFTGRGWDWVDPRNEVDARIASIDAGLDSEIAVARRQGRDYEDIVRERADAARIRAKYGVADPTPAAPAKPAADGAAQPAEGDTPDQTDAKPAEAAQ